MSRENTENSQYILVVESNFQALRKISILAEIKQIWLAEMHLAAFDHTIVKQEENMDFSITEEMNEHESLAITSNLRTFNEFRVTLGLLIQSIDVSSVQQQVKEKQSTQLRAMKFAVNSLTLEVGKNCFQLDKAVEFWNE